MHFLCLTLLLTMNLHLHCGRWWPVVCPPSYVLLNCQKGCIPRVVRSLLPSETILDGTPDLPWYCLHVEVLTCSSLLLIVRHGKHPSHLNKHGQQCVGAFVSLHAYWKHQSWMWIWGSHICRRGLSKINTGVHKSTGKGSNPRYLHCTRRIISNKNEN